MLQFIKRCLENKEYCMKNFIKLESIRELEAFHERYISMTDWLKISIMIFQASHCL